MLPAYQTAEEKAIGKADQFTDYKDANPDTYGITVAPTVGVRPAAEWEATDKLIITYTGNLPTAVDNHLVAIVKGAVDVTDLYVVVASASKANEFTTMLKNAGMAQAVIDAKVHFVTLPNDSVWTRDYGPISLVSNDDKVGFIDPRYYPNRIYDDAIPTKLGTMWGVTTYRAPLEFEGGNFMSDTKGNCFTSQGALWANASLTEQQVTDYFKSYFGCKTLTYLEPLEDGTTHIDMFSKLVSDTAVVVGKGTAATCTAASIATMDKDATLFESLGYAVHRIPMPNQKDGVWRTYTNSLIVNGVHLWPIYSINKDLEAEASNVWKAAAPTWTHVGILSDEIITWGGATHCVTQTTYKGQAAGAIEPAPAMACNGDWSCYPGVVSEGCGEINNVGCCDGQTLKYCENNALKVFNCSSMPSCGWQAQNSFYDCGTAGAADPSGKNPKACPTQCVPDCTGKACGDDGCGGSCGTCPAGQSCQAGVCAACTADCAGKACGDDGCGGSCGTCPAGQTCQAGACVPGGGPDQCLGMGQPSAPDCGDVSFEGCCDPAGRLLFCDGGQLFCLDCAGQNPSCGWSAQAGFYDCGTDGSGDPSGANPLDCVSCNPPCAAGFACKNGQCVACTPSCAGKTCGSDGCGGTCGTCPAGQLCQNGQCAAGGECAGACGGQGASGCFCDESCFQFGDCCGSVCTDCPTLSGCGGGGCNPPCGPGQTCQNGMCVPGGGGDCAGACGGQGASGCYCDEECFNYGDCCGSVCEDCPTLSGCGGGGCNPPCGPGQTCQNGMCVPGGGGDCAGSCGGAAPSGCYCDEECFNYGDCCGSVCEDCPTLSGCGGGGCNPPCGPGQTCQNGQCVPGGGGCGDVTYEGCCSGETLQFCDGGQLQTMDCSQGPSCGWQPQGNFYDCGTDGSADPSGTFPKECSGIGPCTPNCAGKECGPDGCNGLCGQCPVGEICQNGVCAGDCVPSCAGKQCGPDGCNGMCGNCPIGLTCVDGMCTGGCTPSCAGKQCGTDGCGGTCGNCPMGLECDNGACVDKDCTPACSGKQCGDDGCGGTCGTCPAGLACTAGMCTNCTPACDGKECGSDGCGGVCGECAEGEACDEGLCVSGGEPECPLGQVWTGEKCALDAGDGGSGGSSSDCTVSPVASPAASALLLALLSGLLLVVRRGIAWHRRA
jgi:agmatine/peptidylarginine deiminase